jgi:hypothetical protein
VVCGAAGSAAPSTKRASGRDDLPQAERQPLPPRRLADAHAPVPTQLQDLTGRHPRGPSSFYRAKITVKGTRYAHVATRWRSAPTLECDLPRQDHRRLSGGRGKTEVSDALSHHAGLGVVGWLAGSAVDLLRQLRIGRWCLLFLPHDHAENAYKHHCRENTRKY